MEMRSCGAIATLIIVIIQTVRSVKAMIVTFINYVGALIIMTHSK